MKVNMVLVEVIKNPFGQRVSANIVKEYEFDFSQEDVSNMKLHNHFIVDGIRYNIIESEYDITTKETTMIVEEVSNGLSLKDLYMKRFKD